MAVSSKALMQQIQDLYINKEIKKIKKNQYKKLRLGYPVMFVYNAKWKSILPYWDAVPMPIILAKYSDGFLGLNIHYLPWAKRLMLAERLVRATKNKNRITYPDIKSAWKSVRIPVGWAYLIIRRYLVSHIRGNIATFTWEDYKKSAVNINGSWKKASEQEVFRAMNSKWRKQIKKTGKKPKRTGRRKRK